MTVTPAALGTPAPFIEVRVKELGSSPSAIGLCVGYELGEWRSEQFVDHIMEWLPEFSLSYSELQSIHSGNMVALLREAAKKVYTTEKFKNRGEFGELFLHIAIRQVFESVPAISKIYYKSSLNDTVKGFDAVHVVIGHDGLELWLGEAKFYEDVKEAINAVVAELKVHTQRDYLKDEFVLISGKIDSSWPHASELKKLLSPNTSLDHVFKKTCIPILLTYDSACVNKFTEISTAYINEFREEILKNHKLFASKDLPKHIILHLFLLPIKTKKELVAALDNKLKGLQNI